MTVKQKKIIVCSPAIATGGPEVLHQLVHELRSIGREAYICYYPFEKSWACPQPFIKYDAPQIKFRDRSDTFIMVNENFTGVLKNIRKAATGVWWLSVDNYYPRRMGSKLRYYYDFYKSAVTYRQPIYKMRQSMHFAQSHYAEDFLRKRKITSTPLTDYLSSDHFSANLPLEHMKRENIVLYNPKKGMGKVESLILKYPEMNFYPLQGLNSSEVSSLMHRAKVYIDFGHHPGKDRMPREAAIAGCCVITGIRGSAKFQQDVPIPEKYKLNDIGTEYIDEFGSIAQDIFLNYNDHFTNFEQYRNKISNEKNLFKKEVLAIFG